MVGVAFLSFPLKHSTIQDRTFSSCFSWKLGWKTFYKPCTFRNAATRMCYSMWCLMDTEERSSRDRGCSTEQMSVRTIPWRPRWAVHCSTSGLYSPLWKTQPYCVWIFSQKYWLQDLGGRKMGVCPPSLSLYVDTVKPNQGAQTLPQLTLSVCMHLNTDNWIQGHSCKNTVFSVGKY